MALENLKQNIETEKKIIKEITSLLALDNLQGKEKEMLNRTLNSLAKQLKIINNAIPEILNSISFFKNLENKEEKIKELVKITPKLAGEKEATIRIKDKEKFLEELSLSETSLKRIKYKKEKEREKEFMELKKTGAYAKLSNRFFLWLSNSLISKGNFQSLNLSLRKANMPYLQTTYLSMAFFSTLLAFALGIIFFIFLLFFSFSWEFPFLEEATMSIIRILRNSLIIVILPLFTFFSFYIYPYTEKRDIESRINQELPFVAIHMSAISGSGIEPTQIFKIIAFSEEYPYTKKEAKKIINQVNVYGYDTITALKNTARETSSMKLAELLNGIASTIAEGGSLSDFFEERAKTLLFDYKIDKEKYTKIAEAFMDIYISVMIAAPMILTLLLVLISVSGMGLGLSMSALTLIIVLAVSLINIIFIVFLNLNQPQY